MPSSKNENTVYFINLLCLLKTSFRQHHAENKILLSCGFSHCRHKLLPACNCSQPGYRIVTAAASQHRQLNSGGMAQWLRLLFQRTSGPSPVSPWWLPFKPSHRAFASFSSPHDAQGAYAQHAQHASKYTH